MFDSKLDLPSPAMGISPPREASAGALAWFGLAVLVIVAFFANIDRQILVLLTEPIRQDFGLSDLQIGLLQGAGIALFAGAAALPIGWVADRVDRRLVLAVCILVWSAATATCGLTTGFWQLFIASIGLGIGEAGLMPIIYGMIPDLFPARQRVLANSVFALVNLLGAGAGMALGGALLQGVTTMHGTLPSALASFSPWRLAFFAVAIPAPLLVILVAMIRPKHGDPSRHQHAAGQVATSPLTARVYFRREWTMMAKFFGAIALVNMAFAGITAWMPIVAVRNFGAAPAAAGGGLGAAASIGSIVGCILGWLIARRIGPRFGVLAPMRVCEWGALAAGVVSLLYLTAGSVTFVYGLFGLQFTCVVAGMVLFPAIMQSICPAHLRSRVAAIGVLTTIVVQAGSPVFIGVMSDHLHAVNHGLLLTIIGVALVGFLSACVLMRAAGKGVRDAIERYA
ncbi:MFS transporter [Ralstonia insidiosa]|jgi:MFS family permease|uniref:MFS transporter n=1 Tax=Ralstonia insidiosa TaxID=190721 RepID=A0A191ZTW6_9RALS|nr:MFS transporter [Ralstonia insidiosa]ANJ71522.1 MFS transporter [Ralstonia insidiosa]KAB0472121.1 MFS transporter [Ralstonia insidiosa]MBY4908302.1 MFS transporter [Ralstonia insidiosa]